MAEETLFQASAKRVSGQTDAFNFCKPIVLTNSDFRFIVTEQLQAVAVDPGSILIEPEGRNTGPAVLAAALHAYAENPEAILLVAPSDHVIPDVGAFYEAISRGLNATKEGQLVTFGVAPARPETGYGYLELAESPDSESNPVRLKRFVEKPELDRAVEMLDAGNYLWNAGIFLFAAKDILAAYRTHAPELIASVQAALDQAQVDLGFLRLAPEPWSKAPDISVDYAVMERAENLSVVPFDAAWSDLGGWDAVWQENSPDENGMVTSSGATSIDCHDTLLRSESEGLELVGIGLEGIIAVAMNDAVLVADKSRAQDVKLAVAALKKKGAAQATAFPKDHRPWGWFERLVVGNRFQVKRILVHPGASLSLQSHFHRSEHWIVVEGTAKVTIDDEVKLVTENESVYLPLGCVHRMENPGKLPMVLIEVQTGAYVGEDDIVRYEDVYARS
jgi:mannose-1-phosphate guanylyltransferase/mannose-6-phosphate isomerase